MLTYECTDDLTMLLANWYGASLFCLQKADYLRDFNFGNVQAMAILQVSCSAVGDFRFRSSLLSISIRIAGHLGLPFKPDEDHTLLQCEMSRRLWWTLVICEW